VITSAAFDPAAWAPGHPDMTPADTDLVRRYLAHAAHEKRLAERTLVLYALDLHKLSVFAVAAGVGLMAVQHHQVRRWVGQMHATGRSGRGIALVLSGWRGFYNWLCHHHDLAHNPVAGVRAPKAPRPLPKALGVEEALQLANHQQALADPVQEARDRCMVELLYGGGLRLGELLGLDVDGRPPAVGWVDAAAGEVHVLGKGGKRRTVPLGPVALEAWRQWLSLRGQWLGATVGAPVGASAGTSAGGSGRRGVGRPPLEPAVRDDGLRALFVSPRGRRLSPQGARLALRDRSQRAGLATPVHPHMLRHSFASHVLQSSGDIRAVQELLGHAHIGTTQVYTRLDFQHLARAYDAAHPRAGRQGAAPAPAMTPLAPSATRSARVPADVSVGGPAPSAPKASSGEGVD
jgi:integrase/recombinase XerC